MPHDQVRTKVNDLLATGASHAMALAALGDDNATLEKMRCVEDPSAQTLDYQGVSKQLQALEEVSMAIVGGFDVHRNQITFEHVDTDTG